MPLVQARQRRSPLRCIRSPPQILPRVLQAVVFQSRSSLQTIQIRDQARPSSAGHGHMVMGTWIWTFRIPRIYIPQEAAFLLIYMFKIITGVMAPQILNPEPSYYPMGYFRISARPCRTVATHQRPPLLLTRQQVLLYSLMSGILETDHQHRM